MTISEPTSDAATQPVVLAATPPGPGIWAALGWTLLLIAAPLVIGLGIAIIGLFSGFGFSNAGSADGALLIIGSLVNLLIALTVVSVLFRSRTKQVLALRGLRPLHLLLVVLTVLPLTLVASEVNNWVREFLGGWNFTRQFFAGLSEQSMALVLVAGCLLPGLAEEIYFRGFIGRGLVARHGVFTGILFTSLLFGLVHLDPVQASSAVVIGIGLQAVFLASKSLLAPILLHALNNAVAFSAQRWGGWLPIPGYTVVADEKVIHTPWQLILPALAALVGLGLVYYQARTRWVLRDGLEWSPGYVTAEEPPALLAARPSYRTPPWGITLSAFGSYFIFVAAAGWVVQVARSSV